MALKGQLIWGPTGNGAYFSFEWTATQNKTARTSTVSWKLYGRGRSSSPTWIASNYYLSINGSEVSSFTKSWPSGGSSEFSFYDDLKDSDSFTVYHDSSGAGSFDVEIYAFISSGAYNWDTVDQTFDLDNIGSSGPYYSWVNLGQTSTTSNSESVAFNLASNQVGYYWYWPPGDGTITIYSTGNTDTYGGFGTGMSLSSTETSGGSIVTGESYSCQDDIDGSNNRNFICEDIPVTGGDWAGQVFVHGYSNAVSGTLHIDFTPAISYYTCTINPNGGTYINSSGYNSTSNDSYTFSSEHNYVPISSTSSANGITSSASGIVSRYYISQPTKTGYTFNGWTSSTGATISSRTFGSNTLYSTSSNPNTDFTATANWKANTYTVTFNANGGNTPSVATKTVTYGSTYGTLATCTRTGYTFDGWYTAISGGTKITSSTNVTITGNQNLYAHWTANTCTVLFDANGGTASSTSKTVTYDSTYGTLPTATRSGWTFQGWYTERVGGTKITSSTSVNKTTTHTLYAQWVQNKVTVTIENNNNWTGSYAPSPSGSNAYDVGTEITITQPLKDGYHFVKWVDNYNNIISNKASFKYTITESITLTSYADPNTFDIQYNANGGTGIMGVSTHTYGVSSTLSKNKFTKDGYVFVGWAYNRDAKPKDVNFKDGANMANIVVAHEEMLQLYAIWRPYTMTYICTAQFSSDGKTLQWVPAVKYMYTTGLIPPEEEPDDSIIYYIDTNNNYYIDMEGNYYIYEESIIESGPAFITRSGLYFTDRYGNRYIPSQKEEEEENTSLSIAGEAIVGLTKIGTIK